MENSVNSNVEANVQNNNSLSEVLMEKVQVANESVVEIILDGKPMTQDAFLALEVHPLCNLFSGVVGSSYRSLKADIAEQGMNDAITIYEGKILDGKVRKQICCELLKENKITGKIHLQTLPRDAEPIRYLISRNLQRRHLNESQRAIIGVRILTGSDKDFKGRTDEQVAELFNISSRQAISGKQVIDKGCPELVRLVEEGIIRVNMACNLITLSKDSKESLEKQQEAIRLAENVRKLQKEKNSGTLQKRQQELKSAEEKLEKARNAQKEVALNENAKDDEMVRTAEAFKKAKENRDKAQGSFDAANRTLETGCHEPMRKAIMDYIASLLSADTPHDILLLVKMNGELKVSCEIMPHTDEHADGIMIHEFNSHADAVTYQTTHQAEIEGLISRAKEQFTPIYETMKSNAAQLIVPAANGASAA